MTDARTRDRQRGRTWARAMSPDRRSQYVDDHVLGCFDWRDWHDEKPPAAFTSAAFDACQALEESEAA